MIYCADATLWNVFSSPSPVVQCMHDVCTFVHTLYNTQGYPLFFALGPRQLLEGVPHAMIGKFCLCPLISTDFPLVCCRTLGTATVGLASQRRKQQKHSPAARTGKV